MAFDRKQYNRQYYQAHKEEIKARNKVYYWAHRDEILSRRRAQREAKKSFWQQEQRGREQRQQQEQQQQQQFELDLAVLMECGSKSEARRIRNNLALIYHPDQNRSPNATEMMKLINKAYQALA